MFGVSRVDNLVISEADERAELYLTLDRISKMRGNCAAQYTTRRFVFVRKCRFSAVCRLSLALLCCMRMSKLNVYGRSLFWSMKPSDGHQKTFIVRHS